MKEYFSRLYTDSVEAFHGELKENLKNKTKRFIITANPEAFVFGTTDSEVDRMLTDPEVTVVADGIGLVKSAELVGTTVKERISGVDIAEKLLSYADELSLSVFLFGAKPEVIEAMRKMIAEKYPNLNIAGAENGYVEDKDAVFETIKTVKPDVILVALGMPLQEKLIYKHYSDFEKGIFVGVGGSFDVLSGTKKRAPEFFIKHNIEWLYRIATEPKRIKRFLNNNIGFLIKLKKELKAEQA